MSTSRPGPRPRADRLADIKQRRFVLLALAHDDHALDRQARELAVHGADGGLVGGGLIATATEPRGGDGRHLGHPDDLQATQYGRAWGL